MFTRITLTRFAAPVLLGLLVTACVEDTLPADELEMLEFDADEDPASDPFDDLDTPYPDLGTWDPPTLPPGYRPAELDEDLPPEPPRPWIEPTPVPGEDEQGEDEDDAQPLTPAPLGIDLYEQDQDDDDGEDEDEDGAQPLTPAPLGIDLYEQDQDAPVDLDGIDAVATR